MSEEARTAWTRSPPSEPGIYWLKHINAQGDSPVLVTVRAEFSPIEGRVLYWWALAYDTTCGKCPGEGWTECGDQSEDWLCDGPHMWAGPIVPPQLPDELHVRKVPR